MHAFGWSEDDWDRIAADIVAGHINECGAQASGGNSLVAWEELADPEDVGYPIIEARSDGSFVVTKHGGTGGRVTRAVVSEQLLYELGDPTHYITPDAIADFTTIQLEDEGSDRVRVHGVKGRARTDMLKVSIAYQAGWKAAGTLVFGWPDPVKKAREADRILRAHLATQGAAFDEIRTEFVGWNSTHGVLAREPVEVFSREIAPLILTGPPTVTGFAGGRPKAQEIVAYWPALIDRREIEPGLVVEVTEA